MNDLFQKFLSITEAAGLPEGELLTVSNALKKAFETSAADTITKVIPIHLVICATEATTPFTLTFTKKLETENDCEFLMNASFSKDAQATLSNKRIKWVEVETALLHCFVNCEARKISVQDERMHITFEKKEKGMSSKYICSLLESETRFSDCYAIHEWCASLAGLLSSLLHDY